MYTPIQGSNGKMETNDIHITNNINSNRCKYTQIQPTKEKEIMNKVSRYNLYRVWEGDGEIVNIYPCKECGNDKGIRIESTMSLAECTICHKACTIKDGVYNIPQY
jgi:hypothetical protein